MRWVFLAIGFCLGIDFLTYSLLMVFALCHLSVTSASQGPACLFRVPYDHSLIPRGKANVWSPSRHLLLFYRVPRVCFQLSH